MEKTWKPTAAGIMDIAAGALSLVLLILLIAGIGIFMAVGSGDTPIPQEIMPVIPAVIIGLSLPVMAADVVAIVGGVYALRRQKWGLALAGAICAVFGSTLLGVLAIVFTAMAKSEFK